ncbi:MAG: type II toxin-antitoxin system prevent-host-death family antitoxin [Sulfuritalea sp.]|nr:type II toxin-antitoxin system prevent-host-death family antitoxin [Sulfuritalea sp.]MCC7311441.1 type II toxin-antitoxin system prevent-host-death family antitoxin [Sulfuritalea sp.]
MRTMTLAATKAHLSAVVDRVQAGEEVVITRRGRAVARIVADRPAPATSTAWIEDLAAFVAAQPLADTDSVATMRALDAY